MSNSQDPVWRFLLPSLVFVGIFSLYPILESFRLSFYRMILTLPWLGQKFVGWENYRDLITDPVALGSLSTSVIFVAVTTPIEVLLGLAMRLFWLSWCARTRQAVDRLGLPIVGRVEPLNASVNPRSNRSPERRFR